MKQIIGDIALAAIILLALLLAMGLTSDYDAEVLNQQALVEARQTARAEQKVRDRKMHEPLMRRGVMSQSICNRG